MPLIYNDKDFHWVADDEPYNSFEYFVARKLYVKLEPATTPRTTNELESIFRKYGPVEKVELRHPAERDMHYAYTFFNDKDACFALAMEQRKLSPILKGISPAYTWKQPSVNQRAPGTKSQNSQEPSLLMLNDHCLLKIIEFCDLHTRAILWKVCQKTRNLLEDFFSPKLDQYLIEFRDGEPVKRLKQIRDELEYAGPHIRKLSLKGIDSCFSHEPPLSAITLRQCHKYVGASLKELAIAYMPSELFSDRNWNLLQPLLLQIESLFLQFKDDCYVYISAPKLKSLNTDIHLQCFEAEMHFPQLEKLTLSMNQIDAEMERFLKNHQQLKYLRYSGGEYYGISTIIASEAHNLEELVIDNDLYDTDYSGADFRPLEKCKKLKKFVLHDNLCDSKEMIPTMESLCTNLTKLKSLRSLMIAISVSEIDPSDNSEGFADFGREIPQLEYFYTDVELHQSTIIEFIKHARHLKAFCVVLCETVCPMSIDFIRTLVATRKTLFEDGCDKIEVLNLVFFPPEDHAAHQNIELDAEMAKYVSVSFLKSSAEKFFDPELMLITKY